MRHLSSGWKVSVALFVILVLATGMALAAGKAPAKGAKCPANTTQLTGCIKSMEMKAGKMMLDCNGVKHQVVLAKNAKIVIDNKPAKLADLTKLQKSSTKITVHGKCGKGTEFTADKITASTKPQKPKRA